MFQIIYKMGQNRVKSEKYGLSGYKKLGQSEGKIFKEKTKDSLKL